MVVHSCNPSTQEVEAGGLEVPGQSRLHTEFEAPWDNVVKSCFKNK
jgi:hypothetical protein